MIIGATLSVLHGADAPPRKADTGLGEVSTEILRQCMARPEPCAALASALLSQTSTNAAPVLVPDPRMRATAQTAPRADIAIPLPPSRAIALQSRKSSPK
jgi:hypothetical protein